MKPAEGKINCGSGRPPGTGPMTGASLSHNRPTSVPPTRASRGAGSSLARRRGQIDTTTSVREAMAKALPLMLATAPGNA